MNTQQYIKSLKDNGFKVTIKHYRYAFDQNIASIIPFLPNKTCERFAVDYLTDLKELRVKGRQNMIYPKGGLTPLSIQRAGSPVYTSSDCSIKDQFQRSLGLRRCIYKMIGKLEKIDPA